MIRLKNANYILIGGCFVLKFMDVLVTFLVIKKGGVELNPLGYNALTITLGFIVLLPLIAINIVCSDRIILFIVSIATFPINFMLLTVINKGVVLL